MNNTPQISFCTLVLNGMPFLPYHYRMLYPHAHQLIYVEGSCPNATNNAQEDGHSRDGTLELLRELKRNSDPENKLVIITAESVGYPDGKWPGDKDEMSEAFVPYITGNWLWCMGIDEFYHAHDIKKIKDEVLANGEIDIVNIKMFQFWGGLDYISNGFRFHQLGDDTWARIFKWKDGYRHTTHRPITVVDQNGVNLIDKNVLKGVELEKKGIFFYHYSYVLPLQVREKCLYYSKMDWGYSRMQQWAEETFFKLSNPFQVDSSYVYPSWLERFSGTHPAIVIDMWQNVLADKTIEKRGTDDIERLLNKRSYRLVAQLLKRVPRIIIRSAESMAGISIRLLRSIRSYVSTA